MFNEAKSIQSWDLADPKTMRSNFTAESFYVVISGLEYRAVSSAALLIKTALLRQASGVLVKGPLALPTERRRNMTLREVPSQNSRGMYFSNVKRIRNVLLVQNPTSEAVASLVSMTVPAAVNIKIEPYNAQYDLKEAN